ILFCCVSSEVARELRTRSIFRSEYHSGGRRGIQSAGAAPARKSFERLGRSTGGALSALIIVNGPPYPSRRNMSAAASPAAPPPMMTIEEGCTAVVALLFAGGVALSFTKIFFPICSTRQHWIESSAGARRASPVRRLKHA